MSYAWELSQTISNDDLLEMLNNAKVGVKDWTVASKANKSFSRGANWNLFAAKFDVNKKYSHIFKWRLVQEFEEFLPVRLQRKKVTKEKIKVNHAEPDFSKFN